MARSTSFRLPEDLLDRLEAESRSKGISTTGLVTTLLDEGLKVRQFPGVAYRDGPTGRRAGLVGGPDIWEVIRDLRHAPGKGVKRIEHLAGETGLSAARIRLAAEFFAEFPDEIEARITADEQASERVRRQHEHRERLLSS